MEITKFACVYGGLHATKLQLLERMQFESSNSALRRIAHAERTGNLSDLYRAMIDLLDAHCEAANLSGALESMVGRDAILSARMRTRPFASYYTSIDYVIIKRARRHNG